ncbi:hypothetical protein [Hoeflea alexandrii]|uniref:hypothetical protein n=1 Tax=Hoeflea alexandrii TaxID=288436 RepID=UPI0022AEDE74|nr:hypothetical protein [Hoeflea alexandrii]MCZ4291539.1 hypothetical protein [Hoeflea alexandrii]
MTKTTQNDTPTAANRPTLDLDTIKPDLEALASAAVDKTLQQARDTSRVPVLGSSSALATFYMMMPGNDGRALKELLDIVLRHVDGLAVIRKGLKFGIDPNHKPPAREANVWPRLPGNLAHRAAHHFKNQRNIGPAIICRKRGLELR